MNLIKNNLINSIPEINNNNNIIIIFKDKRIIFSKKMNYFSKLNI